MISQSLSGQAWKWMASASVALLAGLASCQTVRDVVEPAPKVSGPKATFTKEPEIRVRIAAGTSQREFSGPARFIARPSGGGNHSVNPTIVNSPVSVTSGSSGIVLKGASGDAAFPAGVDVDLVPAEDDVGGGLKPAGESLMVGKTRYPGFATIRPEWTSRPGAFDLIITMPVESYLPGVLTHELLKDWPRQTYEAQAVAARTYALHERARARAENRTYDVEDTTNDQVYGGTTAAITPNEAVRATRGQVLTYEGGLIRAYFSSTCGGRPSSAAKVWRTDKGYEFNLAEPLQGKARSAYDQNSKWYRWTVTRRDDEVSQRLRAWGKGARHAVANITRVREVEVSERNAAQRPVVFKLVDDRGTDYSITAEELRTALNQPVGGLPPITVQNRVHSGDIDVQIAAPSVVIHGRGWGHGVGLCQYCAKGMADAGLDWATMVKEFYPGAQVTRAYP